MLAGVSSILEPAAPVPFGLHDVDHLRDVLEPDGLEELAGGSRGCAASTGRCAR